MVDKEKQLEERIKAQDRAEQLSLEHKHLLLQWATGVGKGKAVMQCIAASPSSKKWLVVVPEVLQIGNYHRDMIEHGYEWLLGTKIQGIICYASLHLYEGQALNLALNEAHRMSDLRTEIVKTIDFDQIISDSATLPQAIRTKLWDICPYHNDVITLEQAIKLGILPTPAIYTIPIKLDNKLKQNKVKMGTSFYTKTDFAYNKYLENQIVYWREKAAEEGYPDWIETKIIRIGSTRKKFLAEAKTKAASDLLFSLQGKRLIVFCGSVEQCQALGGLKAIHSKKSKKVNESILAQFNNYEINELFVNKMGREGLNLSGIEAGVIIQLDSGNDEGLSFLQKSGRSMRASDPEIYIFYAEDTQDEYYLEKALQHIDKQYIKKLKL